MTSGALHIVTAAFAMTVHAALAQCPNPRPNGYCPETTLRTGEVPLWQMQFKGAHNAFQLNEPMNQQIDDYNNWMVELDLHYDEGELIVEHHCGDQSGSQTFDAAIAEIASSVTKYQKVTFIYIGQGDVGGTWFDCYDDWPSRTQYFADVYEVLLQHIPADTFYTHGDFRDVDDFTWPSVQELVRRGQHFVPIFKERDANGNVPSESENFFFNSSAGAPSGSYGNMAFGMRDGGCDSGGTPEAWTPQPRVLMRGFPSSSCSLSCSLQNEGYWEDGINQGFTFITNNCVDTDLCVDPRIHSPMPYFVTNSGSFDHNWGTRAFPRVRALGLYDATKLVSPMVDIRITPGTYNLNAVPQFFTFDQQTIRRPMVLRNRTGAGDVILQ